jgi:hypothetical protein
VDPPRARIAAMRIVDMSWSNAWTEFSSVFRRTRDAHLGCCLEVTSDGGLWSAIHIWLFTAFDPQFNESPDCFGPRRKIELRAAPVVYHSQKLLRDPHLKRTIVGAMRGAATRTTSFHCGILGILGTLVLTLNGVSAIEGQADGKRQTRHRP